MKQIKLFAEVLAVAPLAILNQKYIKASISMVNCSLENAVHFELSIHMR